MKCRKSEAAIIKNGVQIGVETKYFDEFGQEILKTKTFYPFNNWDSKRFLLPGMENEPIAKQKYSL